jgi:hypothetical protein
LRSEIHEKITATLAEVAQRGDFVAAIYEGLLGNQADGLYPGRTGKDTVTYE